MSSDTARLPGATETTSGAPLDESERQRHRIESSARHRCLLRGVEPRGGMTYECGSAALDHSVDRRHEQRVRVERVGMIDANLVEDLAEQLQVFGDGPLACRRAK